jgi:hypothetical protein
MSVASIAGTARTYLRDFPKYFEVEQGPMNVLTIRLPHPMISPASLQVFLGTPEPPPSTDIISTPTTDWDLDDRNGLLKLTDTSALNKRVLVSGYYYTWFSDSELALHAGSAAEEVLYNTTGDVDDLEGVYVEVTAMSAVVRALWSLCLEFSMDIDVSTPEGMYIPARQRFQQVLQMLNYWQGQYNERAAALNIGLGALEQFKLRRVAYLTNRLVPLYRDREADDPRWPKRLLPPIPDGVMEGPGGDSVDVIDVTEALTPADMYRRYPGWREIGWTTLGTSGA